MATREVRVRRGVTAIVVSLVMIGASSGVIRTLYPATLGMHAEALRSNIWEALDLYEPFAAKRHQEVTNFESRYAARPGLIILHACVGSAFMLAGLLQFAWRLRTRYIHVHRFTGAILVGTGVVVAVTGVYFGAFIPAAGVSEAVIITVVGARFVFSLAKGVLAIRRSDVRQHGEWMTRAFAVALGIATVRIVAAVADLILTPRGWSLKNVFILSLLVGWATTIGAAELWIARNRAAAPRIARQVGARADAA